MRSPSFALLGRLAVSVARRPIVPLLVAAAATALLLWSALNISFDYNYLNLEPRGLKSIALQDRMIAEFDVTPDMVLITTPSVEESRRLAENARDLRSVGLVTTISDYMPSPEEQRERLPYVEAYRRDLEQGTATALQTEDVPRLMDQLYRLEDNVIELAQLAFAGGQDKVDRKTRAIVGDLEKNADERHSLVVELVSAIENDPERATSLLRRFQESYVPVMRRLAMGMADTSGIEIDDLPDTIVDRFASRDYSRYLVSIYPKEQVWNLEFLGRFTDQMFRLDPRMTGMPPIFYVLIDYIARDGTIAAILTLIVVFALLWIDFRELRMALLAMVPLLLGAIWMVGLMHMVGMKFNIVNVIGIPLILGIGIDDGVHILHRFRVEGKSGMHIVFSSTGKAVVLTSLTTMLAFGSLGFAVYRGLASMGITLLIGVGTALLSTLLVLPALLRLVYGQDVIQKATTRIHNHT